ncbi:hypothetical protein Bca52824_032617 [Brassica carinata]|uniref:Uncharacterized protein n=1 Tax=Brassica carinata TaxID=52824 RepID=A0A8X7V8U2_BRACI|nr:hypothetical protein Bca52824_032617 [Brassica carinata]
MSPYAVAVNEPGTPLPSTKSGTLPPVIQLGDHIEPVESTVENTLTSVAQSSSLPLDHVAGVVNSAPGELKPDSGTVAESVVSGKSGSLVKAQSSTQKLGAWAKPLSIQPSSISTSVFTLGNLGSERVQGLSAWPSLSESHRLGNSKKFPQTTESVIPAASKTVINPPAEIIASSPRPTSDISAPVVVSPETSNPLVETSSPQHPAFIFAASPIVVAPLEVPSLPSSPIIDLSPHGAVVPSEQGNALPIKNQDSDSTEPATNTSSYNEVVTSTSTLTTTVVAESNHNFGSQIENDMKLPPLLLPPQFPPTPIRQSSSNTADEIVSNNAFGVLQNETVPVSKTFDLSGYENIDVLIARERSRGGRPYKPSQKMQEMEWTHVGGRRSRGRGGRGRSGRGYYN